MKTLEMMIEADTDGKTYKKGRNLFYSKEKGFVKSDGNPWVSGTFEYLNDLIHDNGRYSYGWEPVKIFTDDEKTIARCIPKEWKWIAREKDGALCVFKKKPVKDNGVWEEVEFLYVDLIKHLFLSIKWEDEEPTLIKDIYHEKI